MTQRPVPRRHDRTSRPLVRIGGVLLVGGAAACIALIVSGALAQPPLGAAVAVTLVVALAAASFGAGSLLVVLLAPRGDGSR